jgi:hypothetical protein
MQVVIFSGAEPLVCAKLNTHISVRVRGHFERIISSSEVESLTQAAASVPRAAKPEANDNNRSSQRKGNLDPGEMHQPTHPKKSGPTAGERSGPTAGEKSGPTAGEKSGPTAGEKSGPTAGEKSGPTAGEESGPTAGEENAPAAGDMSEPIVDLPKLASMDCPLVTGPDIRGISVPWPCIQIARQKPGSHRHGRRQK